MRFDILDRKHDIRRWVDEGLPKSVMARNLGCKVDTFGSSSHRRRQNEERVR